MGRRDKGEGAREPEASAQAARGTERKIGVGGEGERRGGGFRRRRVAVGGGGSCVAGGMQQVPVVYSNRRNCKRWGLPMLAAAPGLCVGRLFNHAKPSDLPIDRAVELMINLATATAAVHSSAYGT